LTARGSTVEGARVTSSRLSFLSFGLAALGLVACATSASDRAPDNGDVPDSVGAHPALTGARIRLMAGNITSGNLQAYEQPGIRIFKGLAPDVAMIQEFNVGGNTTSEIRTFVDSAFGTDYTFARGASSEQIPNGIVSRFPIVASGEWTDTTVGNRQFTWAQIDVPGAIDLYAISVHLLSSSSASRTTEAGLLKQQILQLPANAYVVLGGDFNTGSRTEACVQTLAPVLVTTGPFPVDQNGQGNTNANRNKPYDWVLASSNLDALETPVVIGSHTFADGLVADTRVYSPIAELAPALAADSAASNMQHMGVVRDFVLPDAAPQVSLELTAPVAGAQWAAGSSQTIAWSATGISDVKVELATNGTAFTTLAASTPAAAGQLAVTAPATATTTARVRVSALPSGTPSVTSDAFTITVTPPPTAGRVLINEVLANEPGSDTAGEYVELVNSGGTAVDISGWTISDATAVRHVFASGTTLGAGKAIVVFAGASAIPAGLSNAIASSTGSFVLGNSGDTVKLASPSGLVDSVTYTSALASADGVSMNRSPDGDPTGAFVLHTALSASPRSPGVRVSGASF
jgi:endonuclease/exonuclease/phosphatase family metal-dependent hydrolase